MALAVLGAPSSRNVVVDVMQNTRKHIAMQTCAVPGTGRPTGADYSLWSMDTRTCAHDTNTATLWTKASPRIAAPSNSSGETREELESSFTGIWYHTVFLYVHACSWHHAVAVAFVAVLSHIHFMLCGDVMVQDWYIHHCVMISLMICWRNAGMMFLSTRIPPVLQAPSLLTHCVRMRECACEKRLRPRRGASCMSKRHKASPAVLVCLLSKHVAYMGLHRRCSDIHTSCLCRNNKMLLLPSMCGSLS